MTTENGYQPKNTVDTNNPPRQPKSAEEIWNKTIYTQHLESGDEAYVVEKADFMKALEEYTSSAQQRIKELEASNDNLIKIAENIQKAAAKVSKRYFEGRQRIKELEEQLGAADDLLEARGDAQENWEKYQSLKKP